MNRLTLNDLHSIWRSTYRLDGNELLFNLSFNSIMSLGSLWYSSKVSHVHFAEGSVGFIDNNDDTYLLTIDDSEFLIRLYMPSDNDPTFEMNIPGFGQLWFTRFRGQIK